MFEPEVGNSIEVLRKNTSWLGHAYARWKLGRHSAALARKRWLQVCCINLALTVGCVESTHILHISFSSRLETQHFKKSLSSVHITKQLVEENLSLFFKQI